MPNLFQSSPIFGSSKDSYLNRIKSAFSGSSSMGYSPAPIKPATSSPQPLNYSPASPAPIPASFGTSTPTPQRSGSGSVPPPAPSSPFPVSAFPGGAAPTSGQYSLGGGSSPRDQFQNNLAGAGTSGSTPPPVATPKSPYLTYLESLFDPKKLEMAQSNITSLNERTSRELLRSREREDELRQNKIGQLDTGQRYQLGENERLSNRSLADLAIAKGANTDVYDQMIAAGKSVYEAEQAQAKADREAAEPTQVGSSLVKLNPETGKYESVYSAPEKAPEALASQREYEYAKEQGYKGTFLQYQALKASQYGTETGSGSAKKSDAEKQDDEFEDYVKDLAQKVLEGDFSREDAKAMIKTFYPDYDENVIYDLVTDSADKRLRG